MLSFFDEINMLDDLETNIVSTDVLGSNLHFEFLEDLAMSPLLHVAIDDINSTEHMNYPVLEEMSGSVQTQQPQSEVDILSESSSIASLHFPSLTIDRDEPPTPHIHQLDIYDCDETLKPRSDDSNASGSVANYSSDDESARHTLMFKLRSFAREARVSRRHMNSLMDILRDVGFSWFPLDYRTVLKECAEIELMTSIAAPMAQPRHALLVLVCGTCWLSTFTEPIVDAAIECPKCHVSTVTCPRHLCRSKCVLISSLRGRALNALVPCHHCRIGPESPVASRTFRFPLAGYISNAFANDHFAHSAMEPFKGFCELRVTQPDKSCQLFCADNWYEEWKTALGEKLFASELSDGKLFRENLIWSARGPRSLLLIISLDWFPPFKQQDYTVGILTVAPANLTATERARRINTWILAVIEGPKEPGHVIECLRPSFE